MRTTLHFPLVRRINTIITIICIPLTYRIGLQVTKVIYLPHYGSSYPLCPRCHCSLEREYMRFCDRCGQRLMWNHLDHAEVVYPPFAE